MGCFPNKCRGKAIDIRQHAIQNTLVVIFVAVCKINNVHFQGQVANGEACDSNYTKYIW